jgi:hypothetical protein
MSTVLTLSANVTSMDMGRFLELPFTVPEGTCEIHAQITVTPNRKETCIIDVGLSDPLQVRGWSGSTKYDLKVGLDDATPGYLKGDIVPGEWAVLLGVYVIGEGGAEINATITLSGPKYRWLQGDLHLHTVHSDGAYTLADLDRIARGVGLDFVALTDHNTVSQNLAQPAESPVTYIPAMELTTYHGHANLFGVPIPCDDFRVQHVEDVRRLLEQAKQRGAAVSINHPYDDAGPSCQWQWGYEVPFDWLEVWNGPWRRSNQESLALWQSMLEQGQRIIAVGGSDTHRSHPTVRHGYPTAYVYAKSRRAEDILEAIHDGHITLSYRPHGPRLEVRSGDAMMGDEIMPSESVSVCLEGAKPGDVVVIINEEGEIMRHAIDEPGSFQVELSHHSKQFIRAELWRHCSAANSMLMAALSNPIFIRNSH